MFEFATAGRTIFGRGTLKELTEIAPAFGRRATVVTGRNPERASPALELLRKAGVETTAITIPGEPQISTIQKSVAKAKEFKTDFVIGFGGGSAIDGAKAIAA